MVGDGGRWMVIVGGMLLGWCSLDGWMDRWTRWFFDVVDECSRI